MFVSKTYPPGPALPKIRASDVLRRVVVAIELLLLLVLIAGRAFGAVGDAQLVRTGALSVAPSQLLSSAA